jgi:spore coat polysaccharide biosynthesis protein SpsF
MLALVQARMNSSRLPGKALLPLRGIPILEHVVRRVSSAQAVSRVVVATSIERTDDPIVDWCERAGFDCARGSLDDVLTRMVGIAEHLNALAFARVSGDSPLIDPQLVDRAIALFYADDDPDLVSNVWPRTFPTGQSVEVVRVQAARSLIETSDPLEREHVTAGFYRRSEYYRIVSFTSGWPSDSRSMSVDTLEDYERMNSLTAAWEHVPSDWREIMALGDAREL